MRRPPVRSALLMGLTLILAAGVPARPAISMTALGTAPTSHPPNRNGGVYVFKEQGSGPG